MLMATLQCAYSVIGARFLEDEDWGIRGIRDRSQCCCRGRFRDRNGADRQLGVSTASTSRADRPVGILDC